MHPERIDGKPTADLYRAHLLHLTAAFERILADFELTGLVLPSGVAPKKAAEDDQYYPFRPTPHFLHWAPLFEPHAAVVLAPGKKPKLLRETVTSYWERPAAPEWSGFLDAFEVVDFPEGTDPSALLPIRKGLAFLGDEAALAARWGIDPTLVNPKALVRAAHAVRVKKTPYEVACLAEATARAALGHKAALAAFEAGGASELELHLAYLKATALDDAETPYKNIVALGRNAAVLHHIVYGREAPGRGDESLLVDAGAPFLGYGSDITRTWVRGEGEGATRFRALVDGVDALQAETLAAIEVGLPYEALHDDAHRKLGRVLKDVGIVKGSPESAVGSGLTRAFLPHGLGHSLGLQVHDVGCKETAPKPENPYLRNTRVIEEGQVFTIEPGVYFVEALLAPFRSGPEAASVDWKLVDVLATFGGVRIEDNVVVGAGKEHRNLTREHLPRALR